MVAQCGFDQDSVRYHSTSPNPVISYHGSASFLTCIAAFTVKHVYQSYIVEIILRSSFKLEVLEKFNRVHACRVGMRDTCFDATVDLIDDLQQMSVDEFKEQQHGILMCERLHHNFKWQLYYASRGIINAALLDQRIVPSLLLTNLVPMQVFFAEIETAFETHPSKHPELRLKLESCEQIPPHVLTYEQFAHFGLRQLISNSVKFNTGAGKVVIRTRVIHTCHKHFLRFEVIDQGEGLPEELTDCSKVLFTQFGTMSHRREVTGLGLGLWSIKEVLAHFGEGARCGFRRVKRTFKRKSLSCFWFQVPFEMSRAPCTRDGWIWSYITYNYKSVYFFGVLECSKILYAYKLGN
jgi:signal transduction histidine kinase